ncbi:TlpA family protein disulfide reductase [Longitalea luteola]|uniref:TlpA family protein disulfide reductase n=1 Tax=Longitalea luteola TaxID=2812563 RepID=UPI001A966700|nr:redoxin family protein [Longitalea luteola]
MKNIIQLVLISSLAGCFSSEPQKSGKEGQSMPEFSILLTDSTTWLRSAKFPNDKASIFFYFSPYCSFCKAQTKNIVENIDNLKNINFYFISYFPLSAVKEFNNEYKLSKYPNIIVGLDSANAVNDYFEIPAFPYLAIYGKNKKLKKTFIGKIYSHQLKKVAEE